MNQIEWEQQVVKRGADRARAMLSRNEDAGRADNNPYASALYRKYVFPLRDLILETIELHKTKAGRHGAHIALLRQVDPDTAAYIAVRCALQYCLSGEDGKARQLSNSIGLGIQREMTLQSFEMTNPDLFWEVSADLDRRHSKSENHRYAALMGAARNAKVELLMWGAGDREQIGSWCLEALRTLDMIEVGHYKEWKMGRMKERLTVGLTQAASAVVDRISDMVELTMPLHMPCIEPPKPWTSLSEGGYHTQEMRYVMPHCVVMRHIKGTKLLDEMRAANWGTVLSAINAMQETAWQINAEMLDTILTVAKHHNMDEIVSQAESPRPPRPEWLQDDLKKENMDEDQLREFHMWKREMAQWHTDRKLQGTKWGRFYTATRVANEMKEHDAIYFVYQADFRGRLYAQTTGVSPQGSDLQKSLLRFATGLPLGTGEAVRWFKINGANRFGVDKVPYDERIAWVDQHAARIIAMADDPVSNFGWAEADSPLQFLAWAKEFARWRRDPAAFVSHIPVGMDGSCNGLQHFSAMLRDAIGGRATNLLPGAKPNDIYAQVAGVTQNKLLALPDNDTDAMADAVAARAEAILADAETKSANAAKWKRKWLQHGMNRKLVKRSVMTLPYGSTRFSCADFIVQDYLRKGLAPEFEQREYASAASWLSHIVWEAIGEVVVAASDAMAWLQKCSKVIMAKGHQQIRWTTPSGFPVTQVYNAYEEYRISSRLLGGMRLKVRSAIDEPDSNLHKNGIAPNFVHSMDASHMALCIVDCLGKGITDFAMIHDDYGVHAANAPILFESIRQTFVRMYEENDPINDFFSRYSDLPEKPKAGTLDIREVLRSPYFFG